MGCDGHIVIWRLDKVQDAWPDWRELWGCFSSAIAYQQRLEDRCYLTLYYGQPYDWMGCALWASGVEDEDGINLPPNPAPEFVERFKVFRKWLIENVVGEWECWT